MPEKIKENDLVKNSVDAKSGEAFKYEMLNVYSVYKNNDLKSDLEVIKGYAKATNNVFEAFYKDNHIVDGYTTVLRTDTQAYPFVFLTRHTLELLIKFISRIFSIEYDSTHKLEKLWQPVQQELKKKEYAIKPNDMSDFNVLVKAISKLDPDGMQARYTKSKDNLMYKEKPIFIQSKLINETLQKMVETLMNLDRVKEVKQNDK